MLPKDKNNRMSMTMKKNAAASAVMLAGILAVQQANAAIALDRTRAVFNGEDRSMSLSISNQNKELPYLAQAWIEDEHGNKINTPLTALPPLQRVEPGAKSQVKLQVTQGINMLSQDKETLFYFNLREIPPKSNKPNTLQIALQTRIKLFYRPKAITVGRTDYENPYQEKLTMTRQGDRYVVNNPTPYYVTIASASSSLNGAAVSGFNPMMIPPEGSAVLSGSASAMGNNPVLIFINDFGGRPKLVFGCSGGTCTVKSSKPG